MNFSRSYRASIDRVEGISFSVPEYDIQRKAIEQVIKFKAIISELEKTRSALEGRKSEILESLLN